MATGTNAIPKPACSAVFVMPGLDEAAAAALAVPGARVRRFAPDAVRAALGADGGVCAILWRDPGVPIVAALNAGRDPTAAAEGWMADTRAVLELYRGNRRRLVLVDVRMLAAGVPAEARAQLRERLGISAGAGFGAGLPAAAEPGALAGLLVALIVPQIPGLAPCLDELLSASLSPLAQAPVTPDLARLAAAVAASTATADEAELLAAQVGLQQQQAQQRDAEIAGLRTRLQTAVREGEQALARALEDLRAEARQRRAAEKQRDRLARRVGDLSSKLEKVFTSTSWRMTLPLRRFKGLISRSDPSVDLILIDERRQSGGHDGPAGKAD